MVGGGRPGHDHTATGNGRMPKDTEIAKELADQMLEAATSSVGTRCSLGPASVGAAQLIVAHMDVQMRIMALMSRERDARAHHDQES